MHSPTMNDYASYPPQMPHDFELYASNQEQQLDFHAGQEYLDPASCGIHHTFGASYTNMAPFPEPSHHQNLSYHYDAIAQGAKPFQYHTPAGSPQSASPSFQDQPPILSASSESSSASVSSSAMGSPLHTTQCNEPWNPAGLGLGSTFEFSGMLAAEKAFIDPNLVQPFAFAPHSPYPEIRTTPSPYFPVIEHPPSPALSYISAHSPHTGSVRIKQGSASPYLHTPRYHPYTPQNGQRRASVASLHSQHSHTSRKSGSSVEVDETREKGMCPLPECGRVFKDLKAHMLTHQNERPEKCPITTCEYNVKGFARKYDKNRHTLTHYKGTMVCGFCPGSGSAAEKSFNRADVFKRHLTSVHGVEQTPPNSRKKSHSGRKSTSTFQSNVPGTCSTCSITFPDAQEFYEHLDDCVLRVVQQADPSEAINQRLLTSVAEDKGVTETLDRNGLSKSIEYTVPTNHNDDDGDEEDDLYNNRDNNDDGTYGSRCPRTGKGGIKSTKNQQ